MDILNQESSKSRGRLGSFLSLFIAATDIVIYRLYVSNNFRPGQKERSRAPSVYRIVLYIYQRHKSAHEENPLSVAESSRITITAESWMKFHQEENF